MVRLFRNRNNRNASVLPLQPEQQQQHDNNSSSTFLQQCQALIPAEVRMISGCEDEQTSSDVSSYGSTSVLPHPKGRASGAATSALLELLLHHHNNNSHDNKQPLSFQQVLMQLRDKLHQQGHSQIPQLTSSRPLDLDETPFTLGGSNPTGGGARRALLVGINYEGQVPGELQGCHNDVMHMKDYLMTVQGFPARDILVLLDDDDPSHHAPNRANIVRALRHLVAVSQPGDAIFVHYSGHGGLLPPDFNRYKHNTKQYDQTLFPVDHRRAGQIRDFSLFHHFVQPLRAGVTVTCLMDCCHSGSVLDLPYSFRPTHTGRGGLDGGDGGGGAYGMQEDSSLLTNLAFLYMLGGGQFPSMGGLFDNITETLQDTVDGDLEEYQGSLSDALIQDTTTNNDGEDYDFGGDDPAATEVDPGMYGDAEDNDNGADYYNNSDGGADGDVVDRGGGGYDDDDDDAFGNVVTGEDVITDFGGGNTDDDNNNFDYGMFGRGGYSGGDDDDQQDFGSGTAAAAAADLFGGGDLAGADEGCGDEGCGGDLFSTLAEFLGGGGDE